MKICVFTLIYFYLLERKFNNFVIFYQRKHHSSLGKENHFFTPLFTYLLLDYFRIKNFSSIGFLNKYPCGLFQICIQCKFIKELNVKIFQLKSFRKVQQKKVIEESFDEKVAWEK